MHKIQRVSFYFRVIFQIALCLMPIIFIMCWIKAPHNFNIGPVFHINAIPPEYRHALLHTLTPSEIIQAFAVDLVPTLIEIYIIALLVTLFRQFECGKLFTKYNIQTIQRIGVGLLATQFIGPLSQGLLGYILTRHNPPHHRFFIIGMNHKNFTVILTALILLLISWIMIEGYKLYEEQQLTV